MIGATEREISTVATGSGSDRISKAAVVDSLREATRPLETAMAASVQSAALSQLQADAQGYCTREEVARVWLTNVLPALERAPLRTATGGLGTRKLTERLHRMIHGRLSTVMLDELPSAQQSLGLPSDATGGGELPPDLVEPLVATLTAAALRATVHELGDALLSLPGLEGLDLGAAAGEGPLEYGDGGGGGGGGGRSPLRSQVSFFEEGSSSGVSQADAVGAAEGLVRRMLEGALHGHHFALALAMSSDEAAGESGSDAYQPSSPNQPTAKDLLRLREAQAAVLRLSAENEDLVHEHNALLDRQMELGGERNELLSVNRDLEAETAAAKTAAEQARERSAQLSDELQQSLKARQALQDDLKELTSSVKEQVLSAVEASQAAAKASYTDDMRHDRMALEREINMLRASRDAEVAANSEVQMRCDRLAAEKHALEVERAALLAERTATSTRATAMEARLESLDSPRGESPRESPRWDSTQASPYNSPRAGSGAFSPRASAANEADTFAVSGFHSPRRGGLSPVLGSPGEAASREEDGGYPGPTYTSALRDEVRL